MPTGKIPFGSTVVKNTFQDFIPDNNESLVNGYVSETGVSIKWPNLDLISAISSSLVSTINGLFWWPNQEGVVAVSSGAVSLIKYNGGTWSSVALTSAVPRSGPLTFAYDATYCYIADGANIMYSNGTAASLIDIADVDAPTSVSHVAVLDGYVIANNGNNRFYYSNLEDGTAWEALDFASAAGNSDNIVGLVVYNRELFLIGSETTEIWYNDGETPFSRADGGFIERGCIAPASIIKTKMGLFWLDNERNLVLTTGRQPDVLSLAYKKIIDALPVVSDCEASFIEWQGSAFILLNFPTANKSLLYNLTQESWSELGIWNSGTSTYDLWRGRSILNVPKWGFVMVGDRYLHDYSIISPDNINDVYTAPRFLKRTGFINHGNDSLKRSNKITLKIKRGSGDIASATSPKLMIRVRSDGKENWSNIKEIDLGKVGDYMHVVDVYLRGVYHTRQYELSCTDNVPIAFLDAEEDYTVLR